MTKSKSKSKNKTIDVKSLLKSMDYMRWDHPDVLLAFKLGRELQEQILKKFDERKLDEAPIVQLNIAHCGLIVQIGDVPVWCSEDHTEEELTVVCCMDTYEQHVDTLRSIL